MVKKVTVPPSLWQPTLFMYAFASLSMTDCFNYPPFSTIILTIFNKRKVTVASMSLQVMR
ncbi:hypothetical protein AFK69_03810 [Xenorhabdus sp. GDc328]|nr:hypothetical protein AAY47_07640 [Xenorhabdus griffiniae]KOP34566.1 hypothetical protein AFK69_03810 [Xenorhabdus sp. GDc328]